MSLCRISRKRTEREVKGVAVLYALSKFAIKRAKDPQNPDCGVDRWCKVAYPSGRKGMVRVLNGHFWHLKVWCFDFHLRKVCCISPFNR